MKNTKLVAVLLCASVLPATMPAALKERDMEPRQRRALRDFVFAGHWKVAAPLVIKRQS